MKKTWSDHGVHRPASIRLIAVGWMSLAVLLTMSSSGRLAAQQGVAPSPLLSDLPAVPAAAHDPLGEARGLVAQGHFAEAELWLRTYLRNEERSGEAHELLAYTLLRQNKPREALPEYTRAAALEKPTARMLVQVGQAYILLHDEADADLWSLRAVQLDPKDPDAWYGLGRVRQTEQQFTDAVRCFERVLELVPRSVKAENHLGLSYEGMNKLDDAAHAYEQAIAWQQGEPVSRRSEQPLLNLAVLHLHAGRLAEAEPLLTEAVHIAPNDASVHEQLGHLYLQQDKPLEAQREFAVACRINPESGPLHFLLGQADKRLGRQKEAMDEFSLAARLTAQQAGPATEKR